MESDLLIQQSNDTNNITFRNVLATGDDSGECGTNVNYTFTNSTGELIISGSGEMTNYSWSSKAPWYSYRSSIKSVTIPNTITSIGSYAFYQCSVFENLTIPNSITTIGSSAFSSCYKLTNLTIPNSVTTIGSEAFSGCSGLTNLTIPNSVTTIGSEAFEYCSSLAEFIVASDNPVYKSLEGVIYSKNEKTLILYPYGKAANFTIPNNVTTIGSYAFSSFSKLTNLAIPNSVTTIGSYAFYFCTGLTNLIIPNSVTTIGESAFSSCSGLTNLTIPNCVTTIESNAFSWCSGLTNLTIPNCVSTIGFSAFRDCTGLTNLIIPNSVTTIGSYAFYNCYKLTNLTIPISVTTIGQGAFQDCKGLTNLTIPSSVTTIGSYAFQRCSGLTNLIIPNSVTTIGSEAFSSCLGLTNLIIPNSVTTIRSSAFSSCSGLTSVSYNGTQNPGSSDVFSGCSQLTSVNVPKNYQSSDFCGKPVNKDECNALGLCGKNAYWSLDTCTGKLNITGSGTMTNYSSYSSSPWYSYVSSIKTITINDDITSIGNFAFCESEIELITFPKSITSIGLGAFAFCEKLTSIYIPKEITSIGEKAFSYCSNLTSFSVNDNNNYYKAEGDVLFSKNGDVLIAFPCGKKGDYEVPNGITSIEISAFEGNSFLTSITLPRSVTSIGPYAFSNCTSLESLSYDGLTDPRGSCIYSFFDCNKLKEANVPSAYETDRFCGIPVIKPLRTPAPTRKIITIKKIAQSLIPIKELIPLLQFITG